MKSLNRVFLVGLMGLVITLSGCHGSGGNFKTRWVNDADSKKVLELTLQNPSVVGRFHMAVFGGRVRGTYVLRDGDKSVEGRVTQVEDAYRLVAQDGKEQKFSRDRSTGSLKDESGVTWKVDNSTTTMMLKER